MKISHAIAQAAMAQLIAQRQHIDETINSVREILGEVTATATVRRRGRPPKIMPTPTQAHEMLYGATSKDVAPVKRKLSPKARAAIVAAAKRRWARVRAEKAAKAGKKAAKASGKTATAKKAIAKTKKPATKKPITKAA